MGFLEREIQTEKKVRMMNLLIIQNTNIEEEPALKWDVGAQKANGHLLLHD